MSDTGTRNESPDNWDKKESVGRFLRDVILVAVILGGGFGYYYKRTQNAANANRVAKEGKDLFVLDNPKDYAAAELKFQEVLDKYDASHGYSLAALAELNALLAIEHKVADRAANAEKFAAAAMAANPGIGEQFAAKALVDLTAGKAKETEEWLKRDVLDKGAGGAHIFDAYGRALRAQGKLEDARRSFKGAHDADWRNPRFAAAIGESYLEDGDAISALTYFAKGLQSNADHLACKLGKARAQIARGEGLKEAADAIAEVLGKPEAELTPALKAEALAARASLRLFEQKPDEAIADADAAAQAEPTYAYAYLAKARALSAKKDASAGAMFDKAIGSDPHVAAFYFEASASMAAAGESDRAIAYLEKFPLAKDDRYFVRYGDVLKKLGKADDALAKFDAAIKENPMNAPAHLARGQVLVEKKQLEEAAKAFDLATTAAEFFPEAYAARGNLLFELKKFEEGCQEHATSLQQQRQAKASREQLTGALETVKTTLLKAGQKELAKVWEKEAGDLIK